MTDLTKMFLSGMQAHRDWLVTVYLCVIGGFGSLFLIIRLLRLRQERRCR